MAGSGQCPSCGRMFPADGGYCPADGTRIVSSSAGRDDLVGKLLDGRYEIRDPLAPARDGSIGTMYRGFQPSVSRDVAIKVIHEQYVRDADIVGRFLQAGRAAAQLAGPALANVYDVGRTSDGIVYVVSELARGTSLVQHAGRAMPARRVVGLAIQLADALTAIHRQHLVHGDLDPAAIVVDETSVGDQLKLLDVGFSASLVPPRPGYAAPEVLAGQPPTPGSDLYSVGVILYELLVGAPPFTAASAEALAGKHRHEPPPQLPPNIPLALAAIVQRLLGKYSAERFPAASDLRAALREVEAVVGVAVPRASSNPNIALPRTASADYGNPAMPRTASADYPQLPRTASADYPQVPRTTSNDYGQPQLPRTTSNNYSQPQLARTASGDYSQPQPARTASGNYGQPQLARTASSDLGYPVVTRAAEPASSSSRRLIVIALVALIASGAGITAILLAG